MPVSSSGRIRLSPEWTFGLLESSSVVASVAETTQPQDFDPIFSQGVVIVGGHAVNLWASFYADRGDPLLTSFAPFPSKDADIFASDRDLAVAIATAVGWQFRSNPEPRSPVLGAIVMKKGAVELQVDVLRSVTGLTAADLDETETITLANGKSYSVPAPEVMLKAKLANLAAHEQRDRQDERHVRILIRCCAHYLVDACAALVAGDLSEREVIERFMATWRVITSVKADRMERKYALGLTSAIPARDAIGEAGDMPRIRAFYAHRTEPQTGRTWRDAKRKGP